jgi:Tfp pilus assembly protein PilV
MNSNIKNESGMTLVETMMAILILLGGLLTMAQVLAFSVMASKTHGKDSGRVTAAARDKMEELNALSFSDTASNVTVLPNQTTGGVGLTAGGSVYPANPVAGYSDTLNSAGSRTTNANDVAYTRQWQITNDSATLKTIRVSVRSNKSFRVGTAPSTLLITQKAP